VKTNGKTGSILNDDGKEKPAAMPNNGKIHFATLWKNDLQLGSADKILDLKVTGGCPYVFERKSLESNRVIP
jgi:hypothetical protein